MTIALPYRHAAFAGGIAVALCMASLFAPPAAAQSGYKECSGRTGSAERVIAACSRIIDRGNREARQARSIAHMNRGIVYYDTERYDLAIADFNAVLDLDPNYAPAFNRRAMAYRYKPDPDRSLPDFDRAIALEAGNASYALNRGNAYLDLGQYDRAIADYDRAIGINPKFGIAHNQRAVAYRRKGDYARAVADYTASLPLNPRPAVVHANRGAAHRYNNALDLAIADFDAALRLEPRHAPAYRGRAFVYENKGDLNRALADYRSALALDPQNATAQAGLRRIEQRLNAASAPAMPRDTGGAQPQETRVALLIGNSRYLHAGTLANPVNDADAFAKRLRTLGFSKVTLALDMPRDKTLAALDSFAGEAGKADWAVVYYAGHGIEMAGVNFLIPTDATLAADSDVPSQAVPLNHVLDAVEGARKLRLVILDACRDNPFLDKMVRSVTSRAVNRGVGHIEPQGATLVAYAAKHGQEALDGDGANSPFMSALSKHVDMPGVEIVMLFRRVRDDVLAATQRKQEPFIYGSLPSEPFYFRLP
jgi:tetratricopeptide (TPR) repeat protein